MASLKSSKYGLTEFDGFEKHQIQKTINKPLKNSYLDNKGMILMYPTGTYGKDGRSKS